MEKHYLTVGQGVWSFFPHGMGVDVEHTPSGEQFDGEPDYFATLAPDEAREKYRELEKQARRAWSHG